MSKNLMILSVPCLLSTLTLVSTPCHAEAMSPAEYKSMMNNLQKQNQPAPPVTSAPPAAAPTASAPAQTPEQSTPPVTAPASISPEAVTTPAVQTQTVTSPQPTAVPALPAPAGKKPEESQTYTGYVSPAGNQNTNSSTDKKAGWNIQY